MATTSMKVGAAVAGGIVLVGGGFFVGTHIIAAPKPKKTSPASTATSTTSAQASGALVEFRDARAGWSVSYPKGWQRLQSKDTDVVLVVSEKAPALNNGGSISARDFALGTPVTDSNLTAAKEITDKVVTQPGVTLLAQPTTVHEGGLPGWYYFYSFKDSTSGQEGVHSHYFLFKGSTMVSFVFQALPKETFPPLAALYDEVIASFKG